PGDILPVQIGTRYEADCDPYLIEPRSIDGAGKAEHQPAAHVRCAGGKCGHAAIELPPAENVILEVRRIAIGCDPEPEHGHEIDGDGDGNRPAHRAAFSQPAMDTRMASAG